MQPRFFRITLNSAQPALLLRFYEVLGFQFSQKNVDKGSQAWTATLNDISLEIMGITESYSSKIPSVQISFQVESVESLIAQFRKIKTQIMVDPMPVKSDIMAVVIDPDGRAVELLQKL